MRSFINDFIDKISNIKWDLTFYIKFFSDKKFNSLIANNKKYKNKYKGQRCFIVGNGPSLNKIDLKKLNSEIVFSVNSIMSNRALYETINTDFHLIYDPLYFRQNPNLPEEKEVIDLIASINYTNKEPVCIIPYEGLSAFKKYGFDKSLNLAVTYNHRYLTNNYKTKINMAGNLPTLQNVTQIAILPAIYMGFKQIYLLGCDMTSIFLTYEANSEGKPDITNNYHAYTYTKNEVKNMLKEGNRVDNEYILNDYAKTFTLFKKIRKYAENNDVEIYNAGVGGGLDVFNRVQYDTLFPAKPQ